MRIEFVDINGIRTEHECGNGDWYKFQNFMATGYTFNKSTTIKLREVKK